jgi:hypothetical protein
VSEEEEEPPGVPEEEEEPPGMLEEEEPPGVPEEDESPDVEEEKRCGGSPTSPSSHPMKPPPGAREEEWCGDDGWSFPPRGMREKERCGSREKQTSHSGLGPTSS